ncbi:MAG TPA: ABC transporter permease [Actinomycetota bacterium]|jgi:ABC-2 type transport system permease protein|nr:ABC transporter permease [Actinomycetota bacterium]
MSDAALLAIQVRATNKAFWRNPASAFFTFAFPLMFLVIFTALLGGGEVEVEGVLLDQADYYVAAMAAFSVITATYTNLAIAITFTRDAGILKRTKGTPLPAWVYLAGRVIHALLVSILLVLITSAFGVIFYGATIPTGTLLFEHSVTVIVGAMAFAALGLATTAIVPNAEAAPAVVNAIILPLLFLSGVFVALEGAPQWMVVVGDIFPVKHFAEAMLGSFYGPPLPFEWIDVLVVAIWGVAGLLVAVRFFSWEPRR